MEIEDVIELGSSDDEAAPPAPKKIKPLPNAMVHIPNKIRDVTINPVRNNKNKLSGKLVTNVPTGTNMTVNAQQHKTNGRHIQRSTSQVLHVNDKTDKPLQNKLNNYPLKVLPRKPLKVGKLNSGTLGLRGQGPSPILINRLPSSITVTKTCGGKSIPLKGVLRNRIRVNKDVTNNKVAHSNKLYATDCIGEILTVELDDDENSQSTVAKTSPQWYLRPEEQVGKNNLEEQNNREPQVRDMIEITIEDSPVKPCLLGGAKDVNDSLYVTIEDSPVKVLNKPVNEANLESDIKRDKPKSPQSKKKLDYPETEKCINDTIPMKEIETGHHIEDESKEIKEKEEVTLTSPATEEIGDTKINQPATSIDLEKDNDLTKKDDEPTKDNSVENSDKIDEKRSTGKDIEDNTDNAGFHPTFQRFMDLCLEIDNSEDMKTIVEKRMKTYSRQVPKEFVESELFLDMVSTKITLIKSETSKIYLHIKDIVDELKLHRQRKKATPLNENDPVEDMEVDKYDRKRRIQIRKLEKTLKKLERAINKLDEQEVDFDDEEDSVYLLNDRYKERFIRTYEKFCQLTNTKMLIEPRIVIESRPGQPLGPAKKLEKWINKKVPIGSPLPFPDFHDVIKCVREANTEDKLGWNEADIMDEARDLFTRCGKKLQRRRQENEWRLAASRITQNIDPAERDEALKKKLDENKAMAYRKETELLQKYTQKQSQLHLEAIEIDDKEADKSPVESDDDIEDDDNSLEDSQKRKNRLLRLLDEKESKKNNLNNTDQQTGIKSKKETESLTLLTENKEEVKESVNDQDVMDVEKSKEIEEIMVIETDLERRNSLEKSVIAINDKYTNDIVHKNMCVEKIDDFNKQQMLSDTVNEIDSDESVKEIQFSHETKTINLESYLSDDDHTHLMCDDFYGDELNLLEKLNSGKESSSPDSSDLEDSPIAISDSLESNSESEHYETYDVISIENSSCSETETQPTVSNIRSESTKSNVPCDLEREDLSNRNIAPGNEGTIVLNDVIESDEETENIVLAYSEDEDYANEHTDCVKNDSNYVNLQDDSITIGETFVGIVDDIKRLEKDVQLNESEEPKCKDKIISSRVPTDDIAKEASVENNINSKSGNDGNECNDVVISDIKHGNDIESGTSIQETIMDLDTHNKEFDSEPKGNDYTKHNDEKPVSINNTTLDEDSNSIDNYDEAMLISEDESILEDLYCHGPKNLNSKHAETLTGVIKTHDTAKEDISNINLSSSVEKYTKNDDTMPIIEKLKDKLIKIDGNNDEKKCDSVCVNTDEDIGTSDKKLKDVITTENRSYLDDLIITLGNDDAEIKTDKTMYHKTDVNNVGQFKFDRDSVQPSSESQNVTEIRENRSEQCNASICENESRKVVAIQASDCKHDVPMIVEESRESKSLKVNVEPIILEAKESEKSEVDRESFTLKTIQESTTTKASEEPNTSKASRESKTAKASVEPMTLEISQESITTKASEGSMATEANRLIKANEKLISSEVSRELKITRDSEEPMSLATSLESETRKASEEAMTTGASREPKMMAGSSDSMPLETSGVDNNVSSTNQCVPTVEKVESRSIEDTFRMVEMMLDKLFNPT